MGGGRVQARAWKEVFCIYLEVLSYQVSRATLRTLLSSGSHWVRPGIMNPNINIEEFLPRLGGQEPEDGKARYHNQDVEKILEAWINERYSPELMIYQEELVSNLIEMLEAQVDNFDSRRNPH